jgi:hypothetical protein
MWQLKKERWHEQALTLLSHGIILDDNLLA